VVAPKPLVEKYAAKGFPEIGLHNATYLAAIEHLDNSIGRLMTALDDRGLAGNTLVVFLSDNGGIDERCNPTPFQSPAPPPWKLEVDMREYDNAPLREGKGSMYEGGIRVPCIVRWPSVAQAGAVCDTPVHVVDWLPTLLAAAGASTPAKHAVDGLDLRPLLEGRTLAPRGLYWYLPFYEVRWKQTPCAMVRRGDYKLIEFFGDRFDLDGSYQQGRVVELYHLGDDPGEAENLAERMPELAEAMVQELHDWMASVPVPVPGPNSRYEPERGLFETREKPAWLQ
jgi:arylsulfatase A-like enzyme